MKAPEVKDRKTSKYCIFSLLTPKCTFGHQNHFLSILNFFVTFPLFHSKWPKRLRASLWNTDRELFGQKVGLFMPECPKIVKVVKTEAFSIFEPTDWVFALFLTFRPWGGHLPTTVKNLVVYEDFWEPESQNTDFGLVLTKFHISCDLSLQNAEITILSPKWGKSRNFHLLAVRTDIHIRKMKCLDMSIDKAIVGSCIEGPGGSRHNVGLNLICC